ncbi:MAG: PAS domain-containing protein [Methanoregula sp.]|nr:PAS domain-containing protein [Methanoregula sp.]
MSQKNETHQTKPGFFSDASNILFQEVFDRIQTGIIIVDSETHSIVEANPIAEQILGSSRKELIHHRCHGFICPAKEGACPITDQNTAIINEERVFINQKGEKVAVLKTVAKAKIKGKEYLVESFVDISDRKTADDRKVALIGFMNESVLRIRRPLELTKMNMQLIADQVKTGEYESEEIRMELQIQANNISQMIKNLDELVRMVAEERGQEIPQEFREFLLGK